MYVPIRDDDIPAVVALMNLAYRGSGASAGWTTEAGHVSGDRTTAALLRADIAAKPAAFLLKWVDGPEQRLQGCVWLEPLGGGTWYLGSLAADPRQQNSGLGRTMLFAAEDWIRAHGGERVRMTVVNVRETLIGWYVRRGYRVTGETEPWPYGDDRFGVPLRDDLCFMVLEKDLLATAG